MAATIMTTGGHYDNSYYGNYYNGLNNGYANSYTLTTATDSWDTTWTTNDVVINYNQPIINGTPWITYGLLPTAQAQQGPPKKESFIKESRFGIKETNMSRKRLVQVFVVDPDERIDDEHSVLHQSEVLMTSKTNEELLFDTPIKTLLEEHNKYRKTVVDEEASDSRGRDVHLRAVKVRDLEMKVITHAEF